MLTATVLLLWYLNLRVPFPSMPTTVVRHCSANRPDSGSMNEETRCVGVLALWNGFFQVLGLRREVLPLSYNSTTHGTKTNFVRTRSRIPRRTLVLFWIFCNWLKRLRCSCKCCIKNPTNSTYRYVLSYDGSNYKSNIMISRTSLRAPFMENIWECLWIVFSFFLNVAAPLGCCCLPLLCIRWEPLLML